MPRGRILFVDNNADFRTTRARFLHASYHVLEAGSVPEAEQLLQEQWLHLAILDIRLEDDNDEKDISGLLLAQEEAYRFLPKIILTSFPTVEAARAALGSALTGLPLAVDFLRKDEGPEALLRAIEDVFTRHVRINNALLIQTNPQQPVTFPHLTSLIETGLAGERLMQRAEELEDLFRRLFYEKRQITLERLLWQFSGRVALVIVAFQEGTLPESFVVVCGEQAAMAEATQRYHTFAPKALGATGTVLSAQTATMHFTAHAYALVNADLEAVQPLTDLYRTGQEKAVNAALEGLVQHTLATWHHNRRLHEEERTLGAVYRALLRWSSAMSEQCTECIQALAHQLPTLGLEFTHVPGQLALRLHGQTLTYPEPVATLLHFSGIGQPVLLTHTPGRLSGDNILADIQGRTWLTDFAEAGLAPWLWNVVALEATIRFDWVEHSDLPALHYMEQHLLDAPFNQIELRQIEPHLRKPVRVLQTLRRLAAPLIGSDLLPYYLGLAFQATSRFMDFNPAMQLTRHELIRRTHALVAAAMLCDMAQSQPQSLTTSYEAMSLKIDQTNRMVWVHGVRVTLAGQSYDLLCYLFTRAHQLCTRRELVEQVFGQTYDETDSSQVSRLNTAIRRLREKIEDDPSQPRYLLTESGGGYRLIPCPPQRSKPARPEAFTSGHP